MKKSLLSLLVVLLCAAAFFTSCASKPEVVTPVEPVEPGTPENIEQVTPEPVEPGIAEEREIIPATLTKTDSRMLWRIDGTDKNGNPSVVYVLGTFHFADDSIYPLSDEILNAWNSADRLVAEISSYDQERLSMEVLPTMLEESQRLAVGHNVIDELSPDSRLFFYNTFSPEQREVFNSNEPWYLGLSCSSGIVMALGMDSSDGLDAVLSSMAEDAGRTIEGLDALETQVAILRFGDWDEQLVIAEQNVNEIINIQESFQNIFDLYSAYIADDPETIALLVDGEELDEADEESNPVLVRYNKAVYEDRNNDWSEKIYDYLQDGGSTFIFAGSAHFCSQNSVFNIMKAKNYLK